MPQSLYNTDVRNVIVMGVAPIGCAPYYLWKYQSKNGECAEEINDMIMEFNFLMRYTVEEVHDELPDANIIFCDVFEGSMDIIENHQLYGNFSLVKFLVREIHGVKDGLTLYPL